jgi:uncharacterized protein YukJ
MPLQHYGVLKGKTIGAKRETEPRSPHYQVHIEASAVQYRMAVNVKSQLSPSELLVLVDVGFQHSITASLPGLPIGFTPLRSQPGGPALDFIRGNLFNRLDMRLLPPNLPGPNNDLSDQIEHYVARAIQEPDAQVYAFGQRWGPEGNVPDKVFGFSPGNGIHDIHMNQGNAPSFIGDDGVWQDGALMFEFPASRQWVAVFLAFQSQAWHTDDRTGHASPDVPNPGPGPQPSPTEPDHLVRIIGALVNPIGPGPEQETVTLINASPESIDLTGWKIADRLKKTHTISGVIGSGATLVITLPQDIQLGNKGGIITLLNSKGLKVDGVSYTAQHAKKEGWTIVF